MLKNKNNTVSCDYPFFTWLAVCPGMILIASTF